MTPTRGLPTGKTTHPDCDDDHTKQCYIRGIICKHRGGWLLPEEFGPIARHSTARARHRLVLGMTLRRGKFGTVVVVIGGIVPEPGLAWLE